MSLLHRGAARGGRCASCCATTARNSRPCQPRNRACARCCSRRRCEPTRDPDRHAHLRRHRPGARERAARARQGPAPARRRQRGLPPRHGRGQAGHQLQGRRQPAGAVQVQVGLGEVHRRLRQPLDAAGNQHEPRHPAVEGPERPHRGRAAPGQAQPRLLRHRRLAGRQQHRAGHLPPHHRARSAASTCCARRSRRRSTPTPTSTSSRAWTWTRARSSTPTTRSSRSGTRTSS